MGNYAKRDARKVLGRRHGRQPEAAGPIRALRCRCGELAVIAFTSEKGESQFFCEAHQAEAEIAV
jgi:hypothetical protein